MTITVDEKILEKITNFLLDLNIRKITAEKITKSLLDKHLNKKVDTHSLYESIRQNIISLIDNKSKSLMSENDNLFSKPKVIFLCGINGSGKTTTIAKIANKLINLGTSVTIAACDSFRAAAYQQLEDTINNNIIKKEDIRLIGPSVSAHKPSQILLNAYSESLRSGGVLLVDTAGRLNNDSNLMAELSKMIKVINNKDHFAPHETILIIDGNSGEAAIKQVRDFAKSARITGIIVTKLDNQESKSGIVISIIDELGMPIFALCDGEEISDIHDFDVNSFVKSLFPE